MLYVHDKEKTTYKIEDYDGKDADTKYGGKSIQVRKDQNVNIISRKHFEYFAHP